MPKVPDGIDSKFRHILVAAKRAEQLINGARPRVESRFVKPTSIALLELDEDEVPWRKVTAEEFEALRQQESDETVTEDASTVFVRPAEADAEQEVSEEPGDEEDGFEDDFDEPGFSDEDLEDVDDDLLSDGSDGDGGDGDEGGEGDD